MELFAQKFEKKVLNDSFGFLYLRVCSQLKFCMPIVEFHPFKTTMKRRFSSSAGSTTAVLTSPGDGHTSAESDSGQHTLRLSKRSKQTALNEARRLSKDLSDSRTTKEVLKILLRFVKQLPLDSLEDTEFAAKIIVERANKEEDVANKVKLFSILSTLLRYPGVNWKYIVEEIIRCISKEGEFITWSNILYSLLYV